MAVKPSKGMMFMKAEPGFSVSSTSSGSTASFVLNSGNLVMKDNPQWSGPNGVKFRIINQPSVADSPHKSTQLSQDYAVLSQCSSIDSAVELTDSELPNSQGAVLDQRNGSRDNVLLDSDFEDDHTTAVFNSSHIVISVGSSFSSTSSVSTALATAKCAHRNVPAISLNTLKFHDMTSKFIEKATSPSVTQSSRTMSSHTGQPICVNGLSNGEVKVPAQLSAADVHIVSTIEHHPLKVLADECTKLALARQSSGPEVSHQKSASVPKSTNQVPKQLKVVLKVDRSNMSSAAIGPERKPVAINDSNAVSHPNPSVSAGQHVVNGQIIRPVKILRADAGQMSHVIPGLLNKQHLLVNSTASGASTVKAIPQVSMVPSTEQMLMTNYSNTKPVLLMIPVPKSLQKSYASGAYSAASKEGVLVASQCENVSKSPSGTSTVTSNQQGSFYDTFTNFCGVSKVEQNDVGPQKTTKRVIVKKCVAPVLTNHPVVTSEIQATVKAAMLPMPVLATNQSLPVILAHGNSNVVQIAANQTTSTREVKPLQLLESSLIPMNNETVVTSTTIQQDQEHADGMVGDVKEEAISIVMEETSDSEYQAVEDDMMKVDLQSEEVHSENDEFSADCSDIDIDSVKEKEAAESLLSLHNSQSGHSIMKPFTCYECDVRFEHFKVWEKHVKLHGLKVSLPTKEEEQGDEDEHSTVDSSAMEESDSDDTSPNQGTDDPSKIVLPMDDETIFNKSTKELNQLLRSTGVPEEVKRAVRSRRRKLKNRLYSFANRMKKKMDHDQLVQTITELKKEYMKLRQEQAALLHDLEKTNKEVSKYEKANAATTNS